MAAINNSATATTGTTTAMAVTPPADRPPLLFVFAVWPFDWMDWAVDVGATDEEVTATGRTVEMATEGVEYCVIVTMMGAGAPVPAAAGSVMMDVRRMVEGARALPATETMTSLGC